MTRSILSGIHLENFTAFSELDLEFSPGLNVFIGANATGKTHLQQLMYSACAITEANGRTLAPKLIETFLPYGGALERLIRFGAQEASISLRSDSRILTATLSRRHDTGWACNCFGEDEWATSRLKCTYIPAKEMLANAPGFRSLYAAREIHFEGVYSHILDRAYLPRLRKGVRKEPFDKILDRIERILGGKVFVKEEHFFLSQSGNEIEFSLVAEGLRKLALLWLLVGNGSIDEASILLWDEPESNLNPSLMRYLVETLIEFQRAGVQVFVATHSYVVLSEFALSVSKGDRIRYYSMFADASSGETVCRTSDDFDTIDPNLIVDTVAGLYDRDVRRTLGIGLQ